MEKDNEDAFKTSSKCQYKGIQMRSLLEKRFAHLLDQLNIEWSYEPEYFQLKRGQINYLPDFKLEGRKVFVEVKGLYQKEDESKVKVFVDETDYELILVSSKKMEYVQSLPHSDIGYSKVNLLKCSNCKEYGFVPDLYDWNCRNCDNHNGNNDILTYYIMSEESSNFRKVPSLRIINQETTLEWVNEVENLQ
jgi:hypothetical protein